MYETLYKTLRNIAVAGIVIGIAETGLTAKPFFKAYDEWYSFVKDNPPIAKVNDLEGEIFRSMGYASSEQDADLKRSYEQRIAMFSKQELDIKTSEGYNEVLPKYKELTKKVDATLGCAWLSHVVAIGSGGLLALGYTIKAYGSSKETEPNPKET